MIISSKNYPVILKAMHCIEQDSRGPMAMNLPLMIIPDWYKPLLPVYEKALSELSEKKRAPEAPELPAHVKPNTYLDSEWYDFLNGESQILWAIKSRTPELAQTNDFLNDFFEDWGDSLKKGYLTEQEKSLFYPGQAT